MLVFWSLPFPPWTWNSIFRPRKSKRARCISEVYSCTVQEEVLQQNQSNTSRTACPTWWLCTVNLWNAKTNMGAHDWDQINASFTRLPQTKRAQLGFSTENLDECHNAIHADSRPKTAWMGRSWGWISIESRFWWKQKEATNHFWPHHEKVWVQKQSVPFKQMLMQEEWKLLLITLWVYELWKQC